MKIEEFCRQVYFGTNWCLWIFLNNTIRTSGERFCYWVFQPILSGVLQAKCHLVSLHSSHKEVSIAR